MPSQHPHHVLYCLCRIVAHHFQMRHNFMPPVLQQMVPVVLAVANQSRLERKRLPNQAKSKCLHWLALA